MNELNALIYIFRANITLGISRPLSITVGDIHVTVQWGYSSLEIVLFDEYESFITSDIKEAKKALRHALRHPRPSRSEFPTRAFC